MSLLGIRNGSARAAAVLPASPAFDVSPIEISVEGYEDIAFLITYGRGAAGGAVTYKVEFSNDKTSWFQTADIRAGVFAAGSDVTEPTQRAAFQYTSTSVDFEQFMSPTFNIGGKWCRISMSETGVPGTPGSALAEFYLRGYN